MAQAGLSSLVVVTTCCGMLLHGHCYMLMGQPPYTEIYFLYTFHRLEIAHPTHLSQSAPYIWKDRNNIPLGSYSS